MPLIPLERDAWRAEQKVKPNWRLFYGWRLAPVFRQSDIEITDAKPQQVGWRKQFSHAPGALLVGAAKGTKKEPGYYIVWKDQSIRSITARAFELLGPLPPSVRLAQELQVV